MSICEQLQFKGPSGEIGGFLTLVWVGFLGIHFEMGSKIISLSKTR